MYVVTARNRNITIDGRAVHLVPAMITRSYAEPHRRTCVLTGKVDRIAKDAYLVYSHTSHTLLGAVEGDDAIGWMAMLAHPEASRLDARLRSGGGMAGATIESALSGILS